MYQRVSVACLCESLARLVRRRVQCSSLTRDLVDNGLCSQRVTAPPLLPEKRVRRGEHAKWSRVSHTHTHTPQHKYGSDTVHQ